MNVGKKKERLLKNKKDKEREEEIVAFQERYEGMSADEIYEESSVILRKKTQTPEDQNKLIALKRLASAQSPAEEVSFYPTIKDPKFIDKLISKKEIYLSKTKEPSPDTSIEELCKFRLSENQKFLKNYLSPDTPYNGILLFHGTGVGKTCSSISIAEQFLENLESLNKKVIILLNPSIKTNFMKNIFDIQKLKNNVVLDQCTRDKYLELLGEDIDNFENIKKLRNLKTKYQKTTSELETLNSRLRRHPDDSALKTEIGSLKDELAKMENQRENIEPRATKEFVRLEKRIKLLIKKRYSFYGYTEFANLVDEMEKKDPSLSDTKNTELIQRRFHKMFSETVLIIDEAHNIKDTGGDSETKQPKILPPKIKKVLSFSYNMKLVLLSATPMFDTANEIVFLLNLLLLNDKRPTIKSKGIFSGEKLLENGVRILKEKSAGYISYLRGNDPLKFPVKLTPKIYNDKAIIKQFPKKDILGNEMTPIQHLDIVGCPMTGHQLEAYKTLDFENSEKDFGPFNLTGLSVSNIVFPGEDVSNVKALIRKDGINGVFNKDKKQKYSFKNSKHKDMFKMENIGNYSCKIKKILEYVEKSEGIIFIYSRFLEGGLIPMAMALEQNGFSNFNHNENMLETTKNSKNKYILITGSGDVSSSKNYDKYLEIENGNKDGSKVKVILGSSAASEGLDFRNIREVHILEPWHHLNKLDQVIGRAIRNCSHKNLEPAKRNVMVYYYASINSKKDVETIDLKLYRRAEKKAKTIKEVEDVLRRNAVDCILNKSANIFDGPAYNVSLDIVSSQGTKHTITLAEHFKSMECRFSTCDYKCYVEDEPTKIDTSTYEFKNMEDYTHDTYVLIKKLFKKTNSISVENLEKEFLKQINSNPEYLDILYNSLDTIISKDKQLNDTSVLRKKGNVYIKVPKTSKEAFIYNKESLMRVPKKTFKYQRLTVSNKTKKKKRATPPSTETVSDLVKHYLDETTRERVAENNSIISELNLEELRRKVNFDYLAGVEAKLEYLKNHHKEMKKNPSVWTSKGECKGFRIADGKKLVYFDPEGNPLSKSLTEQWKKETFLAAKTAPKPYNLVGYLEYKKDTIRLKIRDKEEEDTTKATKIKTGSICGNEGMKKGKIEEFIRKLKGLKKDIKIPDFKKNFTKTYGCYELELLLRYMDEKNSDYRFFYNTEEAIIYELAKK